MENTYQNVTTDKSPKTFTDGYLENKFIGDVYRGYKSDELSVYSTDDLVALKKQFDDGQITLDEYSTFFMRYLANLLKSVIKELVGFDCSPELKEDLMHEGFSEIHKIVLRYNASKAEPATFFLPYIRKSLLNYLQKNGVSAYYNTVIRRLNAVARENGYSGLNDEKLSAQKLAILADERLATVIIAREQNGYSLESLDSYDEDITKDERALTPERLYIKKEASLAIREAFEKCTPLQQFLFVTVRLKKTSLRNVLRYLKRPENLVKFEGEVTPKMDQIYLQTVLAKGERIIRTELQKKDGAKKPPKAERVNAFSEQAPVQDFETMFS